MAAQTTIVTANQRAERLQTQSRRAAILPISTVCGEPSGSAPAFDTEADLDRSNFSRFSCCSRIKQEEREKRGGFLYESRRTTLLSRMRSPLILF
jgi:hypothetical protein